MKEIAKALLAIQGEVEAVEKSGKNPHLRNNYATINDVLDAVIPVCQKHGVVVVQEPVPSDSEKFLMLRTRLIHAESGEEVEGTISMPIGQLNPQGFGSALTYSRRYALMALLGLKAEDDDGNAASGVGARPAPQPQPAPRPAPAATVPNDGKVFGPDAVKSAAAPRPLARR